MGLLKNDFGFRRSLTRGRVNVRTGLFLLDLAFDLKKLWLNLDQGRLRTRVAIKKTRRFEKSIPQRYIQNA